MLKCRTKYCPNKRKMWPDETPSAFCEKCLTRRKTQRGDNWRDTLRVKRGGDGWKPWKWKSWEKTKDHI